MEKIISSGLKLIKTILKGKGKASHLTDDAPAEDDPTFTS